ncbi:unnamed protein product [Trichogramma brassicae]|uniref:Uncharacterized protein n=1 Tax=Trichogramma brassicae TaxID=86971 RepID=A0A6H5I0J5_9HYME|nr:unnamed protein product [Trichogramma brassicae]
MKFNWKKNCKHVGKPNVSKYSSVRPVPHLRVGQSFCVRYATKRQMTGPHLYQDERYAHCHLRRPLTSYTAHGAALLLIILRGTYIPIILLGVESCHLARESSARRPIA